MDVYNNKKGIDIYSNRQKVALASERLHQILNPMDIITTDGDPYYGQTLSDFFFGLEEAAVYPIIREFEKQIVHDKPPSLTQSEKFRATHVTRYMSNELIRKFGESDPNVQSILQKVSDASTYSMQPPVGTIISLDDFCLDKITIWRPNKRIFDDRDYEAMILSSNSFLGVPYSVPHLIAIAISIIEGMSFQDHGQWLDGKTSQMVCSVFTALSNRGYLKTMKDKYGIEIPRDFSILNVNAWTKEFQDAFYSQNRDDLQGKWDCESTAPCLYDNSDMFDNEYSFVNHLENGEIIT